MTNDLNSGHIAGENIQMSYALLKAAKTLLYNFSRYQNKDTQIKCKIKINNISQTPVCRSESYIKFEDILTVISKR